MKKMTGEWGKFSLNGEQIGGFKHWTAIIVKSPLSSRVIASQFWMFKKVDTNRLKAEFYAEKDDDLKLIRSEDAIINLPEYTLDKMITRPIEITFENAFDWRSL